MQMEEQKKTKPEIKPATNEQIKAVIRLINPDAKISTLKNKEQLIQYVNSLEIPKDKETTGKISDILAGSQIEQLSKSQIDRSAFDEEDYENEMYQDAVEEIIERIPDRFLKGKKTDIIENLKKDPMMIQFFPNLFPPRDSKIRESDKKIPQDILKELRPRPKAEPKSLEGKKTIKEEEMLPNSLSEMFPDLKETEEKKPNLTDNSQENLDQYNKLVDMYIKAEFPKNPNPLKPIDTAILQNLTPAESKVLGYLINEGKRTQQVQFLDKMRIQKERQNDPKYVMSDKEKLAKKNYDQQLKNLLKASEFSEMANRMKVKQLLSAKKNILEGQLVRK